MRFKDFLLREAKHRQDISIEKATELLKEHCKDALKFKDAPMLRGTKKATEEAYVVQGELGSRSSAHSDSNHYTVILDEVLPQPFPRRSKSIILGNNKNEDWVGGYGTIYAIFPYDGVPIGVCDDNDIFHTTFKIGGSRVARDFNAWNEFFNDANIPDYSFEDVVQGIQDTLDDPEDDAFPIISDIFEGGDVEAILRKAYSPQNTGMAVTTTANFSKYNDKPRELWIGGKCVAIRDDIWQKLKREL